MRRFIPLIVAVACIVGIIVWGRARAPSPAFSDALRPPPPAPERVTLAVTGDLGMRVDLTYTNDSGGIEQATVVVPWEKSFPAVRGAFYSLSAQKRETAGTVSCEIGVRTGKRQIARAESTAAYGIAACSGTVE